MLKLNITFITKATLVYFICNPLLHLALIPISKTLKQFKAKVCFVGKGQSFQGNIRLIRLVKATEILNGDFSKPLSRKSLKFVATQDSHELQVLYAASKTNISISRKLRKR